MFTATTWPVAAAMLPFGSTTPTGEPIHDAPAELWADHLRQVSDLGFTHVDPTDTWIRVADLTPSRLDEFKGALSDAGLAVPAISTSRRSVIDATRGEDYLAYGHRLIEVAPSLGATVVSFGFFQDLTPAQQEALWFWLEPGYRDPGDPQIRQLAVSRIRELGEHARSVGIQVSLEMYEDTYLGSCDDAVSFVEDVACEAVGLNPDLGNLIRLHRPIEPVPSMLDKVLPYTNFWHVKNYLRDQDPGRALSPPTRWKWPADSSTIGARSARHCHSVSPDLLSVNTTAVMVSASVPGTTNMCEASSARCSAERHVTERPGKG